MPDLKTARAFAAQFAECYADTAPKVIELLESAFDDVTAVLALPEMYGVHLRTTNDIEYLNEERGRRETVNRIFPNGQSATRPMDTLMMELNERWQLGRRPFSMEQYLQWRKQKKDEHREHGVVQRIG